MDRKEEGKKKKVLRLQQLLATPYAHQHWGLHWGEEENRHIFRYKSDESRPGRQPTIQQRSCTIQPAIFLLCLLPLVVVMFQYVFFFLFFLFFRIFEC